MLSNNDVAVVTAIAAVCGAVLAAAVTAFVTYQVTKRSVAAAASQAEAQRAHDVALAWTAREQARKLDAYQTIARYVADRTRLVQWKRDRESFDTDPPTPEPKGDDGIDFAALALASLVGTTEVWAAVRTFESQVTRVSVAVGIAKRLDPGATVIDPGTVDAAAKAHANIREHCETALTAGESVVEAMRAELRPGQPE